MLPGLYPTGKSLELDVSYKVTIACSSLFLHWPGGHACMDAAVWTPLVAHGDTLKLHQSLPTTASARFHSHANEALSMILGASCIEQCRTVASQSCWCYRSYLLLVSRR